MADDGYDPLPTWTPPQSAIRPGDHTDPSLHLISPPAHSFLNTTFVNVERFRKREGEPALWIHPDDAGPRRIADGEAVRVHNDLGSVTLSARITGDIIPGTVLAPATWWRKFSPDGRNINQTTPADEADMGAGARFYDVRVWIEHA